ncbi:MAG: hypothetical protein I8H68_11025 [Flavobacteriia bacterium]|nr:hypothetical protein [Flavobacteriia bacterium]MBH2024939.1 hypothetical protein [Flavobacteriales bacterium]
MKTIVFYAAGAALFISLGCSKSTEGNKSIIVEDSAIESRTEEPGDTDSAAVLTKNGNNIKAGEYTERYVAEDGSSALVTFKNTDKENTISIRSNNKTISAPKKTDAGPGVYGNYDFEIVAKKDSVIITQGNNIIALKKARGQ